MSNDNKQKYFDCLTESVYNKIKLEINADNVDSIIENDLYASHIKNKVSSEFQKYYFDILNNDKHFLTSTDFFRKFKMQYSLQGIDNEFLDALESGKSEIMELIRSDDLAELYFKKFNKASIKYGSIRKEKDLGSFFAKLVHTFRPHNYCALDNPIKNHFGLAKESFVLSLFVISSAYERWSLENETLLTNIKVRLEKLDKQKILDYQLISNQKLLDLIFWSKANRNTVKSQKI